MLSKIFTVAVLSAVSAAHAQTAPSLPLSFRTVKLEAKSCQGKDRENKPICHKSEVTYPVMGDRHLDNWVRKQFHGRLPTQRSVQAELNRNEGLKYVNETNLQRLREGDNACEIREMDTLKLAGYTPRYAVFESVYWAYQCGAHGNGSSSLRVLNRGVANPKALEIKDILLPGQTAKLVNLLKEAYVQDRIGGGISEQTARESADRPEHDYLSGDWVFDKNGLTFKYDGELGGGYADSTYEFAIPTRDLQGIIKPEILSKIPHYRKNPAAN